MIAVLGPEAPIYLVVLFEWLGNLLRYLLIAGPAFAVFWVWGRERFRSRLIHRDYPATKHLRREVLYSMSTALVFATVGVGAYYAACAGITRIYVDPAKYGYGYIPLSVLLFIVLQDTYFYWSHRAMHHPLVYRHVHRVHHLSTNPSPWAAYAFAPGEAFVHAIFVPLTALVVPVHPIALGTFLMFMIVRNVWGHLGMELLPRGFARHRVWGWHTTTTHHGMHHSHFRSNYGLYFTWWDRWMGTTHRDYEQTFDAIINRARRGDRVGLQVQP